MRLLLHDTLHSLSAVLRSGERSFRAIVSRKNIYLQLQQISLLAHHIECSDPLFYADLNEGNRSEREDIEIYCELSAGERATGKKFQFCALLN